MSNTNYRLVIAGQPGPVQLRLFVAKPGFARAEVAIQQSVHRRLPVPEVLFHAGSNPFTGHPYALFEWIDGIMLDALPTVAPPQAIDDIAWQLGVLLADMSSFRFPCAGFLDESLAVATPMNLSAEIFLGLIHHDLSAGLAAQRLGAELDSLALAIPDVRRAAPRSATGTALSGSWRFRRLEHPRQAGCRRVAGRRAP